MTKQRKFDVDPQLPPREATSEEVLGQEGDAGVTVGRKAQLERAGYKLPQTAGHGQKHEQSG